MMASGIYCNWSFGAGLSSQYFGVPVTVHAALLDAPSKGSYFNLAIRGRYPFVRVPGLQPEVTVPSQREHEGGAPWPVR